MSEKEKVFDPKKVVEEGKNLVTVIDEQLGVVTFGHLTMEDMFDVGKVTELAERNAMFIWKMMGKAYPDLTLEDVGAMPVQVTARLLVILNADTVFKKKEVEEVKTT